MSEQFARYGWESAFPAFHNTHPKTIRDNLSDFITDASKEQIRAWDDSIPKLQNEVGEILQKSSFAKKYEAILEYELPMESRRTDAIFLVNGSVVVIELKGKMEPSQADIDQAAAYGRDLRCYHRSCQDHPVHVLLVPTRARGYIGKESGVQILGPDGIDNFITQVDRSALASLLSKDDFLAADAYRPLPTIVQAARELIQSGNIRRIHRARAATAPAISAITEIIHDAVNTKSRKLILVTGVPGAGKTLVGLQVVHAHFLDDLSVPRQDVKPTTPAVFLSGNGPLVQVLQYELRSAGGGGKVFVRGVKDYVKQYSTRKHLIPPEHVLIFDEAQRAFDADQVREKHSKTPGFLGGKSEPEHFIEFAERIPEWCTVIGLIGTGQEIHVGEEGGLIQWRQAIEGSRDPKAWEVYGPAHIADVFDHSILQFTSNAALNLDTEIRFHLASDLHRFVGNLLDGKTPIENAKLAEKLENDGYHLRITRSLDVAKDYLRERYAGQPEARFGLIASSKDKDLVKFGVRNDFQSTKRVRFGPWYGDDEGELGHHSCRHLEDCVTEFGAQGLELDAVLLSWGSDLIRDNGKWSNANARGYLKKARVKDPYQLRINAYRVLLTRGRDATVVFIPSFSQMDETFEYLCLNGFKEILK